MRRGFSSVDGGHVSLEPGSLGFGGGGCLISISSTENHVIIETACAHMGLFAIMLTCLYII